MEKLSQLVLLMMDSGLPCFNPETVKHFKERFVLEKSEREAADFMKFLIKKSYSSYSTGSKLAAYQVYLIITDEIYSLRPIPTVDKRYSILDRLNSYKIVDIRVPLRCV